MRKGIRIVTIAKKTRTDKLRNYNYVIRILWPWFSITRNFIKFQTNEIIFNFICDLFMLPFLILNVIEFVLVRSWFKFFPPGGFLPHPSGDVTCSESTCSESSPKMESSESIFFEWTYDGGGGNSKTSDRINLLSSLKIVPTSLSSWSSSSSRRSSWMFELNFHVNRESLRVNPKTVCQTFNLTAMNEKVSTASSEKTFGEMENHKL